MKRINDIVDIPSLLRHPCKYSRNALLEFYWRAHPRFSFFKNVPHGTLLLDAGAGSGALAHWRQWMEPARMDIRLHGIDRNPGEHFDLYEQTWLGELEECLAALPRERYNAIMCSHVLEHVYNPQHTLEQLCRVLRRDGTLYLEMPSQQSRDNPSRTELIMRGFDCSTLNFTDDHSHLKTMSISELCHLTNDAGLDADASGTICLPFVQTELMALGLQTHDSELLTYGLWSATRFAQFVLCHPK